MEEPPIPPARIVDRDEGPDIGKAARGFAYGLLGAIFTMWGHLTASIALALPISRADQHHGPGLPEVGAVAVLALVGYVLLHRIVRPRVMSTKLNRGGPIRYASTSWVHAVFDLLWCALGAVMLWVSSGGPKPGPEQDLAFAFGIGFTVVPGSLFVLRLIFVSRARRALR